MPELEPMRSELMTPELKPTISEMKRKGEAPRKDLRAKAHLLGTEAGRQSRGPTKSKALSLISIHDSSK